MDIASLQLTLILQLQLAGDRRQRGVDIADPGHHLGSSLSDRAALRVGDGVLQQR